MPTTTNFGWTTPADTDLVKDGAAAIRTLGNGIDTSLLDLKGGTTGQVLAKASNTDLDYTWVTQDDANAIQNTIVDAKGDLIAASAADTPARLAVGANDTVLTADSSTATGLKWATPVTGGMTLLSTTTLSSTSTTISSISGSYNDLIVYFNGITSDTASYTSINPNSTNNISTYQGTGVDASVATQRSSTIYMNSIDYYIKTTGGENAFVLQISNYASTTALKPFSIYGRYVDNGNTVRPSFFMGGIATTSAISSLQISKASGSFTGGTVLIYGVK